MPRRPIRAAGASFLLAAALLGCGSNESPPSLSADAASRMRGHLTAVRSSATAGNRAEATRALDAFAADVSRQKSAGRLSAAVSAGLERGIARARRRIAAEVAAPAPAPAPVAPPPVAAPPAAPAPAPGRAKGADGAKGGGKAKGNGKGK